MSRSEPTSGSIDAVVRLFERLLPPIQIRLRGWRLRSLCERLARLADSDTFEHPSSDAFACASLAVLTIRAVTQMQVEIAEHDEHVSVRVGAYARAQTPEDRRRQLERMIDDTAASAADGRADRRALSRHLDLDALRERYDRRREVLAIAVELGVMVVGPAIEAALADPAEGSDADPLVDPRAQVDPRALIEEAEPTRFLIAQLALVRQWPTRLACLESLDATLGQLSRPTSDAVESELCETLLEVGRNHSEHEWVQARAIACLRMLDRDRWRALIRERLGLGLASEQPPSWPVRDFLVRRLILAQLGDHLDDLDDSLVVTQALAHGDPSEFVRIAHAKLLVQLARARPELFVTWAGRLTRVDGSESPRVHATACLALIKGLSEALDHAVAIGLDGGAGLEVLADRVVERLCDTIVGAEHPLVAVIACEQAAAVCELLAGSEPKLGLRERLPGYAALLAVALHECIGDDRRRAAIHEAAAAALETIDASLRVERGVWTRALRAAVDAVPPGGHRRVRLPEHEGARPNDDDLPRILASLTRNDWGLDVDRKGTRLLVRRGDHRTTRVWRILHELRNPAGNKRQAFRHTTGRRHLGHLRAHPSRLDEVTATVVPGERLHIDAEGGWARHLPSVDDVLGLPWLRPRGGRDVVLASSHGLTRMRLRGGLGRRIRSRLRLNLSYAELAKLRRRALEADEPSERRRYADELRERYGVELSFEPFPSPHPDPAIERPTPARVRALFPAVERVKQAGSHALVVGDRAPVEPASPVPAVIPLALADPGLTDHARAWFRSNFHYFLTIEGNSQEALGLFALGLTGLFLGSGYMRRRKIATARAAISLSIGGWGTRGKSGTERLKAGLFHGLGFRTFSKTTGCEAMFIHAAPLGPQVEIFTFRPYGKATIWEQRALLELAAGLESEVFLWECMALNPEYVDILQRGWMRDDLATITNTYPDHEDIQGPAGIDVAAVIARFIPDRRPVISSELAFNPVLRVTAQQRDAEFIELDDHAGDLLAGDLLALFPYDEHPRNIALVAELARSLGIDEELSIVLMADYVYPDLGVLKTYPEVVVRGRRLEFINGCSANERAGFLNNWKRTGCDRIGVSADPARMVITVVNNRDDRVSRSEVFSRILVNDVSVDAHVLIGTNLAGLQIFLGRALEGFVAEQELVDAEGLADGGAGHARARTRLRALLERVRAPIDDWWVKLTTLLRLGLAALGRGFNPDGREALAVRERVDELRERDGSLELDAVLASVTSERGLGQALQELHERAPEDPSLAAAHEVGLPTNYDEVLTYARARIARMVIASRLLSKLEAVLEARDAAGLTRFTESLTKAWITLFKAQVIIVESSDATGDQIIDQCARAVPPGVHVTIMGTQNIKGTGLDFIYRWIALDAVVLGLRKLESDDEQTRLDALRNLDAHSDFGFTDTGTLVVRLSELTEGSAQEASLRAALLAKATTIHREKLAKLATTATGAKGGKLWTSIESWIDFIDGAVRYEQSQRLVQDLIDYRVSHNKMAVEMREIYARAKGGWLGKVVAKRLRRH